ncbi:cytochrome P450 [Actinomycetospora sp. NBRC 106378]|uniref:cytochrome P450 n=1 Tax=Actinomycetospora sp. NBRC 106378 TaxID=3032208 RepID=UPI0024A4E9A9|nr:cytochrome P450 [Actinomycetospora sp. NBRC 106378]GLZ51850.1 cytochrome P450 [Actinomycetospora sp. NBRC 106378]
MTATVETGAAGTSEAGDPHYPMARQCPFDPPRELTAIQEQDPVRRVTIWDGSHPWLVTKHADVRAVLADQRFSADVFTPGYPATSASVGARRKNAPSFIAMDDPQHAFFRKMLISEFSVKAIRALRPMITEAVDGLLDAMADGEQPVDLVQAFALPLPSLVICRMLGVPYADHAFFQARSHTLVDTRSSVEDSVAASDDLLDFLDALVAEREASGAEDDLLGRLAVRHVRTGEITRHQAASMGLLLLVAGHETTANMIALGTLLLLQDPEQAAKVRDGESVAGAVEELLRLLTVTHFGRRRVATEDVEVGGVTIRAGEGVVAAGEIANRDPEVFADPDTLDVDRTPNHHVAFGHGVHQCLGQQLARVELQIAYPALLRRFPGLRVDTPLDDVAFRDAMVVYGVHALPVTW